MLFLNKCDILHRKLESGIRLARYVKSYDDRPNDMETASKCASFSVYDFLLLIVVLDMYQTSVGSLALSKEPIRQPRGDFMVTAHPSRWGYLSYSAIFCLLIETL